VLRVRDMESGQVRPAGRSIPTGRGGMDELEFGIGGGIDTPFDGICTGKDGGWKPRGADCQKNVS
jgi:hypothetical protein